MLTRIQSIGTGKDKLDNAGKVVAKGKQFGKDIKGEVFFPAAGIVLVEGQYAFVTTQPSREQSAPNVWTPKADGSTIKVATAVFKDKASAKEAVNESKLLALEIESDFVREAAGFIKELTPERQKAIMEQEWA